MKFLKQKDGFLGYDANTKVKSKVVVVPFGLEKTVSYGRGTRNAPNEIIKASSKRIFLYNLQKLIPSLKMEDIEPGRSGVRAMALGKNGDIIDDFKIVSSGRNIHVLNAPSPAATACLSIGDTISNQFLKLIN